METLAIRNALIHTINSKYSKVIIENDSMIAIEAINRKSIPSKDICNLVEDIIMLAKKIENIIFLFYRRSVNLLVDRVVKEAICICIPNSSNQ